MAMYNYPPMRLQAHPYRLPLEERKRKAGLHVSLGLPNLCEYVVGSKKADEYYYYSKPMGSPFDIWRLQSGCFGLFCYLLCAFPGFVLETAEIRHTVSSMFTSHHHGLA